MFRSWINNCNNDFINLKGEFKLELSFFNKLLDFISKPINTTVVAALFLTSGFIFMFNFLPEQILIRMNLLDFLIDYNFVFFIVLVGSFFFLVIQLIARYFKRKKDKAVGEYIERERENLFNDEDAYEILAYLYSKHPNPVYLPIHNQKVLLLKQYELIQRVSSGVFVEGVEALQNPRFPFVLQPISERRLKSDEKKELDKSHISDLTK